MTSLLRPRLAAAFSALAGTGMIAFSAAGVLSLDDRLRDAERRSAPSRLIQEAPPCPHAEERLCARRLHAMREV